MVLIAFLEIKIFLWINYKKKCNKHEIYVLINI